jgi:hypothetical protein
MNILLTIGIISSAMALILSFIGFILALKEDEKDDNGRNRE